MIWKGSCKIADLETRPYIQSDVDVMFGIKYSILDVSFGKHRQLESQLNVLSSPHSESPNAGMSGMQAVEWLCAGDGDEVYGWRVRRPSPMLFKLRTSSAGSMFAEMKL